MDVSWGAKAAALLVGGIAVVGTDRAMAEDGSGAASPRETPDVAQAEAEPAPQSPDLRIGTFLLKPRISVSELYDDNIFATRNDKVDDFVTILSPTVRLESDWTRHELDLYAGGDFGRYAENDNENYDDWRVGADGRIDLSPTANLFGGGRFTRDHEERESPDGVNGIEPTIYEQTFGYLGGFEQFGRTSVRLGGVYRRLDFKDVASTTAIINNDDRDRALYELGTRVGYLAAPGYEVFAQGTGDFRRYDDPIDDAGADRDSDGFGVAGGLKVALGGKSRLEVLVGYLYQDYDDGGLQTVNAVDFGARLTLRPSARTTVTGLVDRTVSETTATGASSYLATSFGGSITQRIAPDLSVTASANYTVDDYVGIDRQDHLFDVGLGFSYFVSPNVWISTDYSHLRRDSDAAGEDYDENLIFLRLGAQWSPAYTDDDLAAYRGALSTRDGLSGFYGGAQVGLGELYTGLDGSRGMGGSLAADFGDHGATGGIFAGYGERRGNWYLGAEIEAESSDADWSHARVPGGRVFDVEKNETVGASALLGYYLPQDNLLYARFGVVGTDFKTTYKTAGSTNVRHRMEPGIRFGGGVEVPAGAGLFVRLEHGYTAYRDYDVQGGAVVDNFSNTESLTRLGLGYRFGATAEDGAPSDAQDNPFSGFYVGGQLGHGGLSSSNAGPRDAGSVLYVDRGGHGATGGLFAGYGLRIDNFYLGGELEGDLSDMNWSIERDPNGRVYSVDKHFSVGASAIAGYVLNGSALLYGRVGLVQTWFDTEYTEGANTVDSTDNMTGIRFGGGIEVPASDSLSLRLDYTYTDYDGYEIDYGTGTDSFDNSESLFRLGLAYRF